MPALVRPERRIDPAEPQLFAKLYGKPITFFLSCDRAAPASGKRATAAWLLVIAVDVEDEVGLGGGVELDGEAGGAEQEHGTVGAGLAGGKGDLTRGGDGGAGGEEAQVAGGARLGDGLCQ